MKRIDRYTYRVSRAEGDQEYVATCAEFPSWSWLDRSPEKALAGIRKVVVQCVLDMGASGEAVPEPFSTAMLHLPTSRLSRADPLKLQRQIARHGRSIQGTPPLEVYRGAE